jgi:hypothetical protein
LALDLDAIVSQGWFQQADETQGWGLFLVSTNIIAEENPLHFYTQSWYF